MNITSYNLSEPELSLYQELMTTNKSLSKKYEEIKNIDNKITKTSKKIKETKFHAENRSSARKIGYGFATAATALFLCPLSWFAGTFLFAASMFEGSDHTTSNSAEFLYFAPVKLCGRLFTKATKSKKHWQASLEKRTQEKNQLEGNRLEVFNDINILNEQLKTQLSKITGMGNFKIPKLLHESISLGERVQNLGSAM